MTPEIAEKIDTLKRLRVAAKDMNWTLSDDPDWKAFYTALANDALPIIEALIYRLAECYRLSGAEPSDHDKATADLWDAVGAVDAVRELRKDYDERGGG